MAEINVRLPVKRTFLGILTLTDSAGDVAAGPFPALGKADDGTAKEKGNATASPTLPFGDTPSGSYRFVLIMETGDTTKHTAYSYGPHGAIVMDPLSGDALTAKQNGRKGLLIHGGAPSKKGGLRRTNGCIRLSNADMKSLLDAVRALPPGDALGRINVIDSPELANESDPDDGYNGEQGEA